MADDIEQNTRDYILKMLAQEGKRHALVISSPFCLVRWVFARAFPRKALRAVWTSLRIRMNSVFEQPIIKVQVKSTEGSVGDPILSQLSRKV